MYTNECSGSESNNRKRAKVGSGFIEDFRLAHGKESVKQVGVWAQTAGTERQWWLGGRERSTSRYGFHFPGVVVPKEIMPIPQENARVPKT